MRSQFYVEFPTDPVVNVHWKKKKPPPDPGGGPDGRYCGAWTIDMWPDSFPPPPPPTGASGGVDRWVIHPLALYGAGIDTTPGHNPNEPAAYIQLTSEYLWNSPSGGWTITYAPFPDSGLEFYVGMWRGVSLQTLTMGGPELWNAPPIRGPASAGTITMYVPPYSADIDGAYPVIFSLFGAESNLLAQRVVPIMVQAHCEHETTGGPPPTSDPDYEMPPPPYPAP